VRCYYHADAEAVGVCSSCGRGLCAGSAVEIEGKLACKRSCEEAVARTVRLADSERRQWKRGDFYIAALGAVFLAWGAIAWPDHRLHEFALVLFAIGAAVFCWGLFNLPLALGAVLLGLGSVAVPHHHRHGLAALLFLLGVLLVGWGLVRLSRRFTSSASGLSRHGWARWHRTSG
jgi:hypothetical protein